LTRQLTGGILTPTLLIRPVVARARSDRQLAQERVTMRIPLPAGYRSIPIHLLQFREHPILFDADTGGAGLLSIPNRRRNLNIPQQV
jgi:hypothetical protein